jgi:hypothetical protein
MKFSSVVVFACLVSLLHARTINVADHGIVPGQDVTRAVNDLVKSISAEEGVTLYFPEGQYDFHVENATEIYRAVANHDNGIKRMAFPIFGHKNLTIDGGGSVFMFHGRIIPFTIDAAEDITLKNLTIDFFQPFHAELQVVAHNKAEHSIVVETDPAQYPYTIKGENVFFDRMGQEDPLAGSNMVFDPTTRSPIYQAYKFHLNVNHVKARAIRPGSFELIDGYDILPPIGTVIIVYGVHPTSRRNHAIQVTHAKDIRIENLTVLAAGGMGLIVERTENVTLDRMKVTSRADRIVSTRADATHFIGCKGLIQLENCVFEHMLDDGINVHGAYVPVVEYLGDNTFLCEISHFQQWGLLFGEPGDRLAILSRQTVLPFFETEVSDIQILNEKRFLLTVKELPAEMPDVPLSFENLTWNADLIMRHNAIRENRARSALVSTKGSVLIEDNYFSSQMHGILIEGDNNFWYESGAVQDVLIRNNTFANIGFGHRRGYPLLASPMLTADQHFGEGHYHRNIRFTGNTIRTFTGNIAEALSVEDLTISDNRIEFSTDYPALQPGESLTLTYCQDVKIERNEVVGFPAPLLITVADDSEAVQDTDNVGLLRR